MAVSTSSRLLALLSLLQQRREWSGPDLAEQLGVGPRTVRRDVDKLRELGYPIESAPGSAGGYRLGVGTKLPPLLLDDAEAVAVVVGLRSAASGSISGNEETATRALTKIEAILPSRLRRRVRAIDLATSSLSFEAPPVDADLLVVLAAACRDRIRLRLTYARRNGERSRRHIEPEALVHAGVRWYLVAFDLDRDAWRTFRVDRMIGEPTQGAAVHATHEIPGGDPARFVEESLRAWREEASTPGRIRVHSAAEVVAPRVPARYGTVTADGEESCIVSSAGAWSRSFLVWMALMGFELTVLDPPEMLAEAKAVARRLA